MAVLLLPSDAVAIGSSLLVICANSVDGDFDWDFNLSAARSALCTHQCPSLVVFAEELEGTISI
jgi:hypothetical protein